MTDSTPLDDRLLGLIAGTRHGVLATIAADGRPHARRVYGIALDKPSGA
jgi:hypothetical protein